MSGCTYVSVWILFLLLIPASYLAFGKYGKPSLTLALTFSASLYQVRLQTTVHFMAYLRRLRCLHNRSLSPLMTLKSLPWLWAQWVSMALILDAVRKVGLRKQGSL